MNNLQTPFGIVTQFTSVEEIARLMADFLETHKELEEATHPPHNKKSFELLKNYEDKLKEWSEGFRIFRLTLERHSKSHKEM